MQGVGETVSPARITDRKIEMKFSKDPQLAAWKERGIVNEIFPWRVLHHHEKQITFLTTAVGNDVHEKDFGKHVNMPCHVSVNYIVPMVKGTVGPIP